MDTKRERKAQEPPFPYAAPSSVLLFLHLSQSMFLSLSLLFFFRFLLTRRHAIVILISGIGQRKALFETTFLVLI
jgi:hypothetical protein